MKRATLHLDAATRAALDALVAGGRARSASEAVRRAVAAYVAAELPTWRYNPAPDPRQIELFEKSTSETKKDHDDA